MPGVKTQVGVGRPSHRHQLGPGRAGASRELRVLNFAAKFLCIRQAAVSTTLGPGWRMEVGAWFSTLGGRGPHSRACGQPAWRRLSGALNKHAIIIRGLRSSGDGGGDFARLGGTRVPGAGPDSELILSLCLPCHPAEGARRAGREEKPAIKTHTQACGGARDWGRQSPQWKPLARERPQSGFVQPLLGPGSALSAGSVWR